MFSLIWDKSKFNLMLTCALKLRERSQHFVGRFLRDTNFAWKVVDNMRGVNWLRRQAFEINTENRNRMSACFVFVNRGLYQFRVENIRKPIPNRSSFTFKTTWIEHNAFKIFSEECKLVSLASDQTHTYFSSSTVKIFELRQVSARTDKSITIT